MTITSRGPINAVLYRLSDDLAGELVKPLEPLCSVSSATATADLDSAEAHIVFCGPDADTVAALRQARPNAPIVVVSRHAEVSHWLDSIEAGATDYCAAPFESHQVEWILNSSLRSLQQALRA